MAKSSKRTRSNASRKGWETRRKNAAAREAAAAKRSNASRKGWETRRKNAAAREAAAAKRSKAAKKGWETRRARESAEQWWETWTAQARNVQPTFDADTGALARTYGTPGFRDKIRVAALMVYADTAAQDALDAAFADGTWDRLLTHWKKHGTLPPEAGRLMSVGVRFDVRHVQRTQVKLKRVVFGNDFSRVEAIRPEPAPPEGQPINRTYVQRGTEILEGRKVRYSRAELRAKKD